MKKSRFKSQSNSVIRLTTEEKLRRKRTFNNEALTFHPTPVTLGKSQGSHFDSDTGPTSDSLDSTTPPSPVDII